MGIYNGSMGIESTKQQEDDPMLVFKGVVADFKDNISALNNIIKSREGTLSEDEQIAINGLKEKIWR